MSNKTTVNKEKLFLTPIDKEFFKQKHKSAREHYGNYMDKILEVTGGKVIYDYEEFIKK
ncbi:MAG: hypothetical protein HOG61_08725 [Nitrospina sp.]|nr:hypothetical protein [Nitrospina sp.]